MSEVLKFYLSNNEIRSWRDDELDYYDFDHAHHLVFEMIREAMRSAGISDTLVSPATGNH